MKILLAPDSFKGTFSSMEVIDKIDSVVRKHFTPVDIIKVPIADGGEGTVDSLITAAGGEFKEVEVTGPLGKKVKAKYGIINGKTAVMEMAQASGLLLLTPNEMNPLSATTYGTGEMIKAALDEGIREIIIGIGGSATNDGGIGAAQALGVSFTDDEGKEIGFGGKELIKIKNIGMKSIDPRIKETDITVICDVNNPLTGTQGATVVYGPQKGATRELIIELERGMQNYRTVLKELLGIDMDTIPGSGAAGGLGACLAGFFKGNLKSGIDTVLDIVKFDELLEGVNLVITGEGKIDGQSIYGKVPVGIGRYCKDRGIKVVSIVGVMGEEANKVYDHGISSIMTTVNKDMDIKEALDRADELLIDAVDRMCRLIVVGMDIRN